MPRCTIMPSPSPVRPWHGEQKMLKRSWPRAITSAVIGIGNCVGELAVDLARCRAARRVAELAAGDGVRDERPRRPRRRRRTRSPRAARSCGASCMSCRHAAEREACRGDHDGVRAPTRANSRRRRSSTLTAQLRTLPPDAGSRETSASRGDRTSDPSVSMHEEEPIASTRASNASHVEHRVIRLRQPVERPHADERRQRRAQHRRFERHGNELRPAVERPAADVHRVRDHRRPVLEAVTRRGRRGCRRAARASAAACAARPSASFSSSIGIGEYASMLAIAREPRAGRPPSTSAVGCRTRPSGRAASVVRCVVRHHITRGVPAVQLRLRHDRAHLEDRDRRQEADEQEEQRQEQSDRARRTCRSPTASAHTCPTTRAGSRGAGSSTMMMKRSSHMPTLTNSDRTNSSAMLSRTLRNQNSWIMHGVDRDERPVEHRVRARSCGSTS